MTISAWSTISTLWDQVLCSYICCSFFFFFFTSTSTSASTFWSTILILPPILHSIQLHCSFIILKKISLTHFQQEWLHPRLPTTLIPTRLWRIHCPQAATGVLLHPQVQKTWIIVRSRSNCAHSFFTSYYVHLNPSSTKNSIASFGSRSRTLTLFLLFLRFFFFFFFFVIPATNLFSSISWSRCKAWPPG